MSMSRNSEKNDVPVVDVGSDDEDAAASAAGPSANDGSSEKTPSVAATPQVQPQQQKTAAPDSAPSDSDRETIGFRSFWKAGDYVVGPSSKPAPFEGHAHLALWRFNFPFSFFFLNFFFILLVIFVFYNPHRSLTDFALIAGHLEHARVHPKFLHSNATSHKWAFGGVLYFAHLLLTYA